MTEQQFEAKWIQLRDTHETDTTKTNARFDQGAARLFKESGWTLERIAEKVRKSFSHVARLMRFGRFLDFCPSGTKTEKPLENLTERRFRAAWAKTKATGKHVEEERFRQALELLEQGCDVERPPAPDVEGTVIQDLVIQECGDGKDWTVQQIRDAIDKHEPGVWKEQVARALKEIKRGRKGAWAEHVIINGKDYWRIHKAAKVIPPSETELLQADDEIEPLLDELDYWGRAHQLAMSPVEIRRIAVKLRQIWEGLIKKPASGRGKKRAKA